MADELPTWKVYGVALAAVMTGVLLAGLILPVGPVTVDTPILALLASAVGGVAAVMLAARHRVGVGAVRQRYLFDSSKYGLSGALILTSRVTVDTALLNGCLSFVGLLVAGFASVLLFTGLAGPESVPWSVGSEA